MRILFTIMVLLFTTSTFAETLTVTWSESTTRENGDPLPRNKVAGYVLRHRCGAEPIFASVLIMDPARTKWVYEGLPRGECEIEMQVIDSDGLYSDTVAAGARVGGNGSKPGKTTLQLTVPDKIKDITDACKVTIKCNLASDLDA